jgi:anti-sigma B factor antagonist
MPAGRSCVRLVQQAEEFHIALAGELDLADQDELVRLRREYAFSGACDVSVDLTDVTFMDASALAALVGLAHDADDRGGRIRVIGVQPRVARLIDVTASRRVLNLG